jgi:hypothetical protein
MLRTFKTITMAVAVVLFSATMSMAAVNNAQDAGGTFPLTASLDVTVNTLALASFQLVKVVYDSAGNCLASSDGDAACNGGLLIADVPAGTALQFMIYIENPSTVQLTDISFEDVVDTSGTGFTVVADPNINTLASAQTVIAAPTKDDLQADCTSGKIATPGNDEASWTAGGATGTLNIGTSGVALDAQVDLPAGEIFAVCFDATKI